MAEKTEDVVWSRSNGSIFENFAISLQEYTRTGKAPAEGDQDIQYALELQKKRLRTKGLTMQYKFVPRGHLAGGMKKYKSWSDAHYTSTLQTRTCRMERSLYRGTKKEYEDKENMDFIQTITDVNTPQLIGKDVNNCPNCGAAVTISELQQGCPYCSSHFEISDIFPKVSNYYFYKDATMTEKEGNAYMAKYMIGCGIIFFIYGAVYNIINPNGSLIYSVISVILSSILGGAVMGYFIASLTLGGKLLRGAGKELSLLPSLGTGGRFVHQMQKYSPEFSFEYFSNKIVSLLKMIMFTDNPSDLPVYMGQPLGNIFENIVDILYTGVLGLKTFTVKGDFCEVSVDVFLDNLYDNGKRIFQRRDKYRVWVKKNIRTPINTNFSIKHLQCKSCGMSFDATNTRHCPSCGTEYNLETGDWVVTKIVRRKFY
ncbi:MAG: hypothetical protein K2K46_11215 [Lachnospiraceae bacterium]|nr:hypothetical protein [Lachnospiraceae bacterium]